MSCEKIESGALVGESLRQRAFRTLVATQLIFFVSVAWCVVLEHSATAESNGISYYGVHLRTLLYAAVGYAAAAVGLWRASVFFRRASSPFVVWVGLRVVAASLPTLLLTPYTLGTWFNWAHMATGVLGALVQLAISLTLVRRYYSTSALAGLVVQLIGGVLSAASLPDWHFQYLLYFETIYQLGFGWGLLQWSKTLPAVSRVSSLVD